MAQAATSGVDPSTCIKGVHGIRYQVKDVTRSVEFYKRHLGFRVDHQHLPEFATISHGLSQLFLSGPGASGSRPLPNGQAQQPGGSNRIVLKVTDLQGCITALEAAGVRFRTRVERGPAGSQIQIEDPDGNAIELFEPAGRG